MSRRNSFTNAINNVIKRKRKLSTSSVDAENLLKPEYLTPPEKKIKESSSVYEALVTEEKTVLKKPDDVDVYDNPAYLDMIQKYTNVALYSLIHLNNRPIDTNRVVIAEPPRLPHTKDLFLLQSIMNKYFNEVLNINENIYRFLQSAPGDSAVAYMTFMLHLYNTGFRGEQFHKTCNAVKSFYLQWADQIDHLVELVINLNGSNVVKEIMNIVNQSVYNVVYIIEKSKASGTVPPSYFYNSVFDITDPLHADIHKALDSDQMYLTNIFSAKFNRTFDTIYDKYYHTENETDTIDFGEHKIHAKDVTVKTIKLFRVIK
ncbi:hypothetical protein SlGVgp128 [Spodoptera litura granulovirus]|uniref:Uncharacterized protein n=1 Tax=Spodoptera litura granulovirus TaxID=359919 RepID=A5IZY0_9BBAC|nr:hypothetical protein SlGVgp128 [Spodoptera litura granulovirus]ABQ52071.1 hypothetical protein SlGVgp128 [Spodoptera litura granulovirus]